MKRMLLEEDRQESIRHFRWHLRRFQLLVLWVAAAKKRARFLLSLSCQNSKLEMVGRKKRQKAPAKQMAARTQHSSKTYRLADLSRLQISRRAAVRARDPSLRRCSGASGVHKKKASHRRTSAATPT
jgi:hypothetical protein